MDIKKGVIKKNTEYEKYMLNPLKKNKIYENFKESDKIKKDVIELDYITEFARKFKSIELERKGGMDGERKKRGNEWVRNGKLIKRIKGTTYSPNYPKS